jgi:hypothetical protein
MSEQLEAQREAAIKEVAEVIAVSLIRWSAVPDLTPFCLQLHAKPRVRSKCLCLHRGRS